jgi:uncharacterized protein with GYD domain
MVAHAFLRTGKIQKKPDKGCCRAEPQRYRERHQRADRDEGIWWTLGRYDSVVLFDAPDEKSAMNLVLKRMDRMDIETLVAVPADAAHPYGPA